MEQGKAGYTLAAYTMGSDPRLKTRHVRWKQWLQWKLPAETRREMELWGIPIKMYYRTEGTGEVNAVAKELLALQSQTGDLEIPLGVAVFVPTDPKVAIDLLLTRLEEWLAN